MRESIAVTSRLSVWTATDDSLELPIFRLIVFVTWHRRTGRRTSVSIVATDTHDLGHSALT